jgi:hypothetical protein
MVGPFGRRLKEDSGAAGEVLGDDRWSHLGAGPVEHVDAFDILVLTRGVLQKALEFAGVGKRETAEQTVHYCRELSLLAPAMFDLAHHVTFEGMGEHLDVRDRSVVSRERPVWGGRRKEEPLEQVGAEFQ